MCCRKAGVVGLVGAVLVFLGLVHLVAGVYFMLALPMFQLGSNLWTGAWCGICGVILGTIGWKQQTLRKGQVILVASLSVLVVEVANLVIIQVGEYRVFLSENDRRLIVEDNQDLTMQIAFWLTTLVTALGIVVSFFGAQYLFCVVVRGPRVKGRMPVTRSLSEEDLHHRQEGPDSTPSLEDVVALPDPAGSSAWVYHPEEDKNPTALYPMGLDLLSDFPDGSRRLPARHASFVTPRYARVHQRPQRAQSFVVRRDLSIPDVRLRPPPPVELPSSHFSSPYGRPHTHRIHRSNSVSGRILLSETPSEGAALSRKFHACSLDDLDAAPVIEVGMLPREMSRSENSLSSSFQEPLASDSGSSQHELSTSFQERFLDGKKVLTSFGPLSRPVTRITKPKAPAPPPPTKPKPSAIPAPVVHKSVKVENDDDTENSPADVTGTEATQNQSDTCNGEKTTRFDTVQSTEENSKDSRPLPGMVKRISSVDKPIPLPVIEENIKNTRKRPAPQPRTIVPLQSEEDSIDSPMTKDLENLESKKPENVKSTKPEIVKPPRTSVVDKTLRLADKNMTITRPAPVKKPERKKAVGHNEANLRRLEEVLTNILDHGAPAPLRATKSDENIMESLKALDAKVPKSILKKGAVKPSKYEVAHREAIEDSKALLEQLPHGELQRNKIVLRVPSFRTAGCQTEAYRPVRRRASCAQTNLSVAPRYRDAATTGTNTKPNVRTTQTERRTKPVRREETQESVMPESSSSSSGYSSPEVSSKEPSPAHSGPPSPASSSAIASDEEEKRGDTNVTVIEINRSEAGPPRLPPWHGMDPQPPPRPPKPLRLRHMSDAAALMARQGGLLVPVHRRASQLPMYEDVFGLAALTENVMLLTEAINPVLVHSTRHSQLSGNDRIPSTAPRVVDVIRKLTNQQQERNWDGRTTIVPRNKPALRTNSLTLPRPSVFPTPQPRHTKTSQKDEYSQQTDHEAESSTAAYLASLELLASHYRHQALANAKQLQLQQRLLRQQQRQQQHEVAEVEISEPAPLTNSHTNSTPQTSRPSLVTPIKEESEC
ncbi:uncharacterized protein [Palaemon carinicauda]|uniref:uncharacterized protein n=1 Tax=Palaemon carinicauda TaxID=392227 RepID=UPI0035B5AEEB